MGPPMLASMFENPGRLAGFASGQLRLTKVHATTATSKQIDHVLVELFGKLGEASQW